MTQELRKLADDLDAEFVLGRISNHNGRKAAAEIRLLLERLEKAEKDAAAAIGMLADWCVAVDQNGTGWDDWDERYKDAMYRPCPIREQLDEAIKVSREERQ